MDVWKNGGYLWSSRSPDLTLCQIDPEPACFQLGAQGGQRAGDAIWCPKHHPIVEVPCRPNQPTVFGRGLQKVVDAKGKPQRAQGTSLVGTFLAREDVIPEIEGSMLGVGKGKEIVRPRARVESPLQDMLPVDRVEGVGQVNFEQRPVAVASELIDEGLGAHGDGFGGPTDAHTTLQRSQRRNLLFQGSGG